MILKYNYYKKHLYTEVTLPLPVPNPDEKEEG